MTASDKGINHLKNVLLCRGHPHMPFERGAASCRMGSNQTFAAASTNVGIWHNVRAQLGAFEGAKTAALPTFGPECRVSGAFETWHRGVAKVET